MLTQSNPIDRSELPSGTPAGLILLYHRVTELRPDPQLLCVTPEHFAEHMDALRRYARPQRLADLVSDVSSGTPRPGSVVVTFDDGYADNVTAAAPILEKYGVPAIIYVATRSVSEEELFWWDELDDILLSAGTLPQQPSLRVDNSTRSWSLDGFADYPAEEAGRHDRWSVTSRDDPTPRHAVYRELFDILRRVSRDERPSLLAQIREWGSVAGVRPSQRNADHQSRFAGSVLDERQLARLGDGDLIEVGAHTVTHPVLSLLSEAEQRFEIESGKAYLEGIIGRPVHSFSYPFGTRKDFTPRTVDLVKRAGFESACANYLGLVQEASQRFELPRMLVRDWDGDTLRRRIREAWRAAR